MERLPVALAGEYGASASITIDDLDRNHVAAIYRFCLSQVADPVAAEDLAAEVFMSALEALARTKVDPTTARSWLFRIAANAVVDHYRSPVQQFPNEQHVIRELGKRVRSQLTARSLHVLRLLAGHNYSCDHNPDRVVRNQRQFRHALGPLTFTIT